MNVNHIIIIILIVIILFMMFTPPPMAYTFYPQGGCRRGELGCDPDTWTPEYAFENGDDYWRKKHRKHHHDKRHHDKKRNHHDKKRHHHDKKHHHAYRHGEKWHDDWKTKNKEWEKERTRDLKKQKHTNRENHKRQLALEPLISQTQENFEAGSTDWEQYRKQPDWGADDRKAPPGGWRYGPDGEVCNPRNSGPTYPNRRPPGPPYNSYSCVDGYCTQQRAAEGEYWTSNCDGNCESSDDNNNYPNYPNNYPNYPNNNKNNYPYNYPYNYPDYNGGGGGGSYCS